MAIDRQQICDQLYHGLGKVADSPIPPGIWGRKEIPYEYNPEKAKALLAEAGVKDLKIELSYMSVPRTYFPEPKPLSEVLQAQLGEIGITVDLKAREWASYLDALGKGEHQMGLSGWIADNGDPDNFLYTLFDAGNVDTERGGSNVCQYVNQDVSKLLTQAQALTDQEQRTKLYEQAQQIMHDDAPCLPMVYVSQVGACHPDLEGFEMHPTGTLQLRKAHWKKP
jgi:peptide/nickel transport system substrate-binding protein